MTFLVYSSFMTGLCKIVKSSSLFNNFLLILRNFEPLSLKLELYVMILLLSPFIYLLTYWLTPFLIFLTSDNCTTTLNTWPTLKLICKKNAKFTYKINKISHATHPSLAFSIHSRHIIRAFKFSILLSILFLQSRRVGIKRRWMNAELKVRGIFFLTWLLSLWHVILETWNHLFWWIIMQYGLLVFSMRGIFLEIEKQK